MCAYTVTTREAPASVRYEFPVCGHIVLWTSLVTVVSRQPASRRQSDTGFSKLRAAGAQYCFFVRQTVAVAWPALFVCSFSTYHTSSEHRRFDLMLLSCTACQRSKSFFYPC